MLVLTRKLGESIRIGDDIKITLVELDGRTAKIGIEAPRSVVIHREEVYEKIQAENRAAVQSGKINLASVAEFWKKKREEGKP